MAWSLTVGSLVLLAAALGWMWWRTDRRLGDEALLRADMVRDLDTAQQRIRDVNASLADLHERLKVRDVEISFARRVLREREHLLTDLERTKRQLRSKDNESQPS
jgi:hypothetical protein